MLRRMKTLATVLKARRDELGLSQTDAAQRFGVTGPAYNRWELGVSMPKLDDALLDQLSEFLELSPIDMAVLIVESTVAMNEKRSIR